MSLYDYDPELGCLSSFVDKVPPLIDPVKLVTFFYLLLQSDTKSSVIQDCLNSALKYNIHDAVVNSSPAATAHANHLLKLFTLLPEGSVNDYDRTIWQYDTRCLPKPSKDDNEDQ